MKNFNYLALIGLLTINSAWCVKDKASTSASESDLKRVSVSLQVKNQEIENLRQQLQAVDELRQRIPKWNTNLELQATNADQQRTKYLQRHEQIVNYAPFAVAGVTLYMGRNKPKKALLLLALATSAATYKWRHKVLNAHCLQTSRLTQGWWPLALAHYYQEETVKITNQQIVMPDDIVSSEESGTTVQSDTDKIIEGLELRVQQVQTRYEHTKRECTEKQARIDQLRAQLEDQKNTRNQQELKEALALSDFPPSGN